jgi:hypothetical protein
VTWDAGEVSLRITALATGDERDSTVRAMYEVRSTSDAPVRAELGIVVRPFQVLPWWQDLKVTGGAARVDSAAVLEGNAGAMVNGRTMLRVWPEASAGGASRFAAGDAGVRWVETGSVPAAREAIDADRAASAIMTWPIELAKRGDRKQVIVSWNLNHPAQVEAVDEMEWASALGTQTSFWKDSLNRVSLELPPSARHLVDTFRSQQGYILINRDGPAIQPGSRTYERSWIRDGSLTGSALLATGHEAEVRAFVEWYAKYQYENGKVPCVVDRRGPDPVPEHDSHGQLIYAIAKYYRFSGDRAFVEAHLGNVERAVAYIESLRAQRMTPEYRDGPPEKRAMYGLVPESISHEGYSAKPMHSYWDGFWVIRGLKDAAFLAGVLGRADLETKWGVLRDEYREAMWASMRLAMQNKGIDYIPGCVELGDFDATSTTIGVWPVGELGRIPEPALHRTFDKWWTFFEERRDGKREWKDYTPYENRIIGTYVHLGMPERAWASMDFYFQDQRPAGWNHWAEIVWRDPREARFTGDMPHTWVGSDFVNAARAMFVLEREDRLVIAAAVKPEWLEEVVSDGTRPGVRVARFPTEMGTLNYTLLRGNEAEARSVVLEIGPGLRSRAGLVELALPGLVATRVTRVIGEGEAAVVAGRVVLDGRPGRFVIER